MKVSFKAANEESRHIASLLEIPVRDTADGVDFEFPDDPADPDAVVISSDQGENNQPSYWLYQVGKEKFVYPVSGPGADVLVVE